MLTVVGREWADLTGAGATTSILYHQTTVLRSPNLTDSPLAVDTSLILKILLQLELEYAWIHAQVVTQLLDVGVLEDLGWI